MKFMISWSFKEGRIGDCARKFLAEGAPPPEGATVIGRWHKTDLSGGFTLMETDDPKVGYEASVQWADMIEIDSTTVIEDSDVGPILAKYYGS